MLNTIGIIMGIIGVIATIIQTVKSFIKTEHTSKVQQTNQNGDNIYIDAPTKVDNSQTTTVNINTKQSNADVSSGLAFFAGIIALAIMLSAYQATYIFIPAICLLLLAINVYRDTKVSFENSLAKKQWAIKNIIFLMLILLLMFVPKTILNIINQIPEFHYESLPSTLESIGYNIKFIYEYNKESSLLAFNLFGRILVSFLLIIYLLQSSILKRSSNKKYKRNDTLIFSVVILLMIFGLNVEFFWNFAEPYRNSISTWLNPLPNKRINSLIR
ncbi:hypothetical protein [Lysinibacillus xylanilyticus]|uniref:hypothetical protein n=1 Tax=Lysinibacillus xylanilyticus TaxID=582475 RepID=UPI003D0278B5